MALMRTTAPEPRKVNDQNRAALIKKIKAGSKRVSHSTTSAQTAKALQSTNQ